MALKIAEVISEAKKLKPKVIAVAGAHDLPVLISVVNAKKMGIIETAILTGLKDKMLEMAKENNFDLNNFDIINCETDQDAAKAAVKVCLEGRAQVLFKGFMETSTLLKACVDKETGIRRPGRRFSTAGFMEIPGYERTLFFSDTATNPMPDLITKKSMIENAVELANAFGVNMPKVALLSAKEHVDPLMPSTLISSELQEMNKKGEIKNCIVNGPISMDIAISPRSAQHKGYEGEIQGDADIIIFPNLETANITYKAIEYFAGMKAVGAILGAKVPIIVNSRSDSEDTRLLFIAASSLVAHKLGL